MIARWLNLVLLLAVTSWPVLAQPTMDSLWPNADGMRWDYQYHLVRNPLFNFDLLEFTVPASMHLQGTIQTPGGQAQVLTSEHESPPGAFGDDGTALPSMLRKIWFARPDLRVAITKRYGAGGRPSTWYPTFLHSGYFMKNVTEIDMWQDSWDHPTWRYLENDLTVGATFVMQLIPELADDIFLHGTVTDISATVETMAGVFDDAVKMEYLIDLGESYFTDEEGSLIGTTHSEIFAQIHFVPGVGPVDLLEEFTPYIWMDCGEEGCPPEWLELVGLVAETDELTLTQMPTPVSVAGSLPGVAQLGKNHPNPFNPQTTISFEVGMAGPALLQVYDLGGRLIATIVDETIAAGLHEVDWKGRDAMGRDVPSGVYLSRLEVGDRVDYGRMALVR